MATGEPAYTETEANETLSAAVRLAGVESVNAEELVRMAGEMGISPAEVVLAEERYREQQSEQAQRAKFRLLQRKDFIVSLLTDGITAVIAYGWILGIYRPSLKDGAILSLIPLILLLANVNKRFNERSSAYRQAFMRWSEARKHPLLPETFQAAVDRVLSEQLEDETTREELERKLRKTIGYDRKRAATALEQYLRDHPEVETQIRS